MLLIIKKEREGGDEEKEENHVNVNVNEPESRNTNTNPNGHGNESDKKKINANSNHKDETSLNLPNKTNMADPMMVVLKVKYSGIIKLLPFSKSDLKINLLQQRVQTEFGLNIPLDNLSFKTTDGMNEEFLDFATFNCDSQIIDVLVKPSNNKIVNTTNIDPKTPTSSKEHKPKKEKKNKIHIGERWQKNQMYVAKFEYFISRI